MFVRFTTAALLAAALAGAAVADEPKRGGTLNFLVEPEPPTLVTVAHTAGPSVKVSPKVTEGLLTYDHDLKPQPQLAVGWDVREDGLEYVFKLRPNVKWHDGKDFTSADVAFSILLLKQVHPRGRGTFANVTEVATPDPLTAVIRLAKPAPFLLTALSAGESPIVPKHIYEGKDAATSPNGAAPIGTGPYVFKEWVRGSHVLYERNPNYWDPGKPYIDKLVVKFIPDAAARAVAFETGQVDLGGESPVPLSEVERLRQNPKIGIETRGYNYSPSIQRIEFNLEHPILKDLRVRQAIAHAIDRKVVVNTIWYGYAHALNVPIDQSLKLWHDKEAPSLALDLKKAEALLDEAGYKRGPDGIRFRLTHDFLPYGDGYKRTADYLKQALAKIGIEVTIRSQDFATYIKRVYTERDFDFTNNSMGNTFDPTVGVQRLFWSKNFKKGVPFSNGSGYQNPEVDRLLEAAAVETDVEKRAAQFRDFQRLVVRDLPDLTLVGLDQVTIYNKRVHDHTVGSEGLNGNFAGVWLDP